MIVVSEYQNAYIDSLANLHSTWGQDTDFLFETNGLPQIGYVASEGAIIVAAGFLRRLEGGYAQIDTLVTNRDLPSDMRHEGLTKLVDKLIFHAKHMQLKGLICMTKDEGILSRAQSLGFKVIDQKVIGLSLL